MQDHIHFQKSKLMGAKDSHTYKAQPMLVRSGCGTLDFCPSYIKMKLEKSIQLPIFKAKSIHYTCGPWLYIQH